MYKLLILIFTVLMFGSCKSVTVEVIENFDVNRYMGQWYEIARFDHPFERNMEEVTANYKLREDGKIDVINAGYNTKKKKWTNAKAVAVTTKTPNFLKVFFIPIISASYKVAYIDESYNVAVVTSSSYKYLWILSRTPQISSSQKEKLLEVAKSLGFDTKRLIYVNQGKIR